MGIVRDMKREELADKILHENVLASAYPDTKSVRERLLNESGLVFYYGIDPTGPDVHLGHVVQLLMLKRLVLLGHKAILLFGDFTARIGDPTGKNSVRRSLTEEEVESNLKNYVGQVEKILERGSFEVKRNQVWLASLNFSDVLNLAGNFTVQQMIERDMFQKRISEGKPIGLHEFLYPLMQGYDSVAMNVDGEIGGNDQTFNMLVGRDLIKTMKGKDKIVITTKLLSDRTGKKMSKSEGSLISISDSPEIVYEKVMNTIPDDMVSSVFEMCTEVPSKEIEDGTSLEQHKKLAFELTRMFHSLEDAQRAQDIFSKTSTGEHKKEVFLELPESIVKFLVANGVTKNNSEAEGLVRQGVVWRNNVIMKGVEKIEPGDEIRVGKRIQFVTKAKK